MSEFKAGDIVKCHCKSDCTFVVILTEDWDWPEDALIGWYRPREGATWEETEEEGLVPVLHPDPDKILAEFTAWRLIHGDV